MENFLNVKDVIQKSVLFSGTSDQEIFSILKCLESRTVSYKKQQAILRVGERADSIGLLLSGSAYIVQEDFWGNRNLISNIIPGQIFAETFACVPGAIVNVSVFAGSACQVLFLNVRRVLTTCGASCAFHSRIIQNLVSDLAGKNLYFNEKMTHMSRRTIREKLLSYLSAESVRQGSPLFNIPYNRQQLADYLSVDRSAMSSELSKLRKEGVLRCDKNHFELLQQLPSI